MKQEKIRKDKATTGFVKIRCKTLFFAHPNEKVSKNSENTN